MLTHNQKAILKHSDMIIGFVMFHFSGFIFDA